MVMAKVFLLICQGKKKVPFSISTFSTSSKFNYNAVKAFLKGIG